MSEIADLRLLQQQLEKTLGQVNRAIAEGRNASSPPLSSAAKNAVTALNALEPLLPTLSLSFKRHYMLHDGELHDPLGAGSYVYQTALVPALLRYLDVYSQSKAVRDDPVINQPRPTTLVIHIGAQPNNSPHAGTIVVFALAFIMARKLKRQFKEIANETSVDLDLDVRIQLDLVDTAPDNSDTKIKNGIVYQRSHRWTNAMGEFLPDYRWLLESLADFVKGDVPYSIENQESLTGMPSVPGILEQVVSDHERLACELFPDRRSLGLRCACPHDGCGYADKHGKLNEYSTTSSGDTIISFSCWGHDRHSVSLSNVSDVAKLEFSTPLRNLVRARAYRADTIDSRRSPDGRQRIHMRVTGADYAGFFQEQLLGRQWSFFPGNDVDGIHAPPVTLYAPLIVDWAGSKLSKSLYVKEGAYKYMEEIGQEYLLSLKRMRDCDRDPEVLFREVENWADDPKRLFRCYSLEYLHSVFENAKKVA